jgi:uncharacterized membrane protein HdeD (DUF308 family)
MDDIVGWLLVVLGVLMIVFHRWLASATREMNATWMDAQKDMRMFSADYYERLEEIGKDQTGLRVWMILMGALALIAGAIVLWRHYR